jgi:hypothetical protein
MVLSMKLISLGFDMDSEVAENDLRVKDEQEKDEKAAAKKEEDNSSQNNKKGARRRKFQSKNSKELILSENGDDSLKEPLILTTVPTICEYFGYALCPGTSVLGPWVSYKDYLGIYINPRWVRRFINFI